MKLPFWRTVAAAFRATMANLATLGRMAWLVAVLLVVVVGALEWMVWPWRDDASLSGFLINLTPGVAALLFGAMIAVGWHRLLILAEPPPAGALPRIDARIRRYFLWALGLLVGVLAPVFVGFGIADLATGEGVTADAATGVSGADGAAATAEDFYAMIALVVPTALVVLFYGYPWARLSLLFPAIAVEPAPSAGVAWRASRGNGWRLLLGSLICSVPGMASVFLLPESTAARWHYVAATTMFELVWFFVGMVAVSFLSLAYVHLVKERR